MALMHGGNVDASNVALGENRIEQNCRRKLKLMKACGLFGNDRTGAVYERATTPRDLESAYRLVHDIYVNIGYIQPRPSGLRMRSFECCPETATFVAKAPARNVIGALSVILDSDDLGLPSDNTFKSEIDHIRMEGGLLCEISNQVVHPEFRRKGPRTELMRCALAYAYAKGVTDFVCAVTPSVVPFYEMMQFRVAGSVRSSSEILDDPVVLMRENGIQTRDNVGRFSNDEVYEAIANYFYRDNPYFYHVQSWELMNERMFSEQFDIAELLGRCSSIFENHAFEVELRKRLGAVYDLSASAAQRRRYGTRPSERRSVLPTQRRMRVRREFFTSNENRQSHHMSGRHRLNIVANRSSRISGSGSVPPTRGVPVPRIRSKRDSVI